MIFDYIALNKSNNKVKGEITAEDLASARKRLHSMGLTVLAVNEKKEETQQEEKNDYASFEFKGIDKKEKEIIGTIDAKDSLQAYVRLKNEFFFDVKYIFDLAANEITKEQQKKELAKELQQKYELSGLANKEKECKKEDDKLAELEKANINKLNILRNQVDVMIAQIKTVLGKVKDEPEKRMELNQIKSLIGELERIKMSNNIKHIKSVAERILEIAESLFKDRDEYKIIIKQKKNLKSFDLGKLQQMQYRESVEIKGISGALDKASKLFKKYVGKIGIDFGKDKKITSNKIFKEQLENSKSLLNEVDLIEKNKNDLKNSLKENLKILLSFSKKSKINKWTAFLNSKLLLKVYLRKTKEINLKTNKKELKRFGYLKHFFRYRNINSTKKDYQNIFVEINNFLGWLLCFYFAYFYVGALVLQKNLSFLKTFFYKTLSSEFLLVLFFTFFIFHLLTNLKIKFFRQSFFGTLFLLSVGLFSILFFSLNY